MLQNLRTMKKIYGSLQVRSLRISLRDSALKLVQSGVSSATRQNMRTTCWQNAKTPELSGVFATTENLQLSNQLFADLQAFSRVYHVVRVRIYLKNNGANWYRLRRHD